MKQIRFGGFVVGVALLSAFTAAQAKHNNITKVVDDGTVIENVTLISPERGSLAAERPGGAKKDSEPRWLQYKHEDEKQSWPWWKRLIHRFERCPICRQKKRKNNKILRLMGKTPNRQTRWLR